MPASGSYAEGSYRALQEVVRKQREAEEHEALAKTATVADPTPVKVATVAEPAREWLPAAPVAKKATAAKAATVQPVEKDGFLQLPHTISDNLLRTLEPAEQLVYLRLYRLIYGFPNRAEILVAYETLGDACNLGKRTVVRAVEGLVGKGLVAYEAVISGPRGERGNRYRLPGAPLVKPATGARTATGADVTTVANPAPMKSSNETGETSPSVYDLRTRAARLVEAHRGDPAYTLERLRAALRDALTSEGRDYDEATLAEATRGMA